MTPIVKSSDTEHNNGVNSLVVEVLLVKDGCDVLFIIQLLNELLFNIKTFRHPLGL